MATLNDLRAVVRDIHITNSRQKRNNVVTNTIKRAFDREANAAFGLIQGFYHPTDVTLAKGPDSKTKVLLMKPVGDHCNLKCEYCYEIQRLTGTHEKVMGVDEMRTYLRNLVAHSDISDVFLHGGEPLLAGKKFFKEFIDTIKQMGLYGQLTLGVQTNGTLLDEEWCDFFMEHNFSIGISLDGDEELNDKHRVDHKGRGSYEQVMQGIKLLQDNDMVFGIITVVGSETAAIPGIAKRILDHHIGIGVDYVDVHPAFTPKDTSGNSADSNMSRVQYTSFMTELAYAWAQSSNPNLRLRCIEDIIQNLTNERSVSCFASGYCTSIIGVDPSGAVSPCTRPFHNEYTFGNAGDLDLQAIEQQDAFKKFVKNESKGQDITKACEWSGLCGFGNCPHERFTDGKQDPAGKHVYCSCHHEDDANNGYPGFYKNLFKVFQEYHQWLLQTEYA
ncbi:radical SAM/SPASM domain-containing protein [Roseivirga pacifica]|uniref:radical SAM/SPASM domain-containing protein n=1 Tax=Roseivirga pacifica TaxID=1267423 RepID=UPI0020944B1D|nr:radical SAM protein [Roseivirga pacifica]MCO6360532.1 radical SAM protein [Roseivirga pacifica]MCO6368421.1 radical SAM protein [Roseivirga pacifica]MCO6372563.1 radical SAM protein [Roseivirga pacifica]MCO6376621.1 radical SAM protein [Roseivirga pacifica]MCO6378099.1 radical SAM protein [Roseivirga pacifica]